MEFFTCVDVSLLNYITDVSSFSSIDISTTNMSNFNNSGAYQCLTFDSSVNTSAVAFGHTIPALPLYINSVQINPLPQYHYELGTIGGTPGNDHATSTTSNTFSIPTNFTKVKGLLIAGGGGGGGRKNSGDWGGGGGGGANAMYFELEIPSSASTSLTIGNGGYGGSGHNSNSNSGTNGSSTRLTISNGYVEARPGFGGKGNSGGGDGLGGAAGQSGLYTQGDMSGYVTQYYGFGGHDASEGGSNVAAPGEVSISPSNPTRANIPAFILDHASLLGYGGNGAKGSAGNNAADYNGKPGNPGLALIFFVI